MVSEHELYSVCIVVQHPSDPELFLGTSRKNDQTDFGLPGGKIDLLHKTDHKGYPYTEKEDPREAVCRELLEETGLVASRSQENLKNLYTRQDKNGSYCRCYLAMECDSYDFVQSENEGLVKWCSWEELEAGSFGEYNKKAHAATNAFLRKNFNTRNK